MKGDARLLTFDDMESIAQTGAEILFTAKQSGLIDQATGLLYQILDMLFMCLESRRGGQGASLADIRTRLAQLTGTPPVEDTAPEPSKEEVEAPADSQAPLDPVKP